MDFYKHLEKSCKGSCCLKIQDLSVRFGESFALENVNLHIHCGDIVALIGPNGAGKSTLLKAVLGQIPSTGTITFHTAAGQTMKPLIGYVPQTPSFDKGEPISVLDLFVAAISKRPVFLPVPKKLRERITQSLCRVHGEGLINKRISDLSGGELQRVLLALALEPLPNILILYEPTSGVDVDGIHLLRDLLDEIRTKYDLSILLTTHDFSTMGSFATKVVLLNKKVLISGSPRYVFSSDEFKKVFSVTAEPRGREEDDK